MCLDVNYLTRLPVFDIGVISLNTRWFNLVFVSETRLLKRGEKTLCIAPLENINGLSENVKKNNNKKE